MSCHGFCSFMVKQNRSFKWLGATLCIYKIYDNMALYIPYVTIIQYMLYFSNRYYVLFSYMNIIFMRNMGIVVVRQFSSLCFIQAFSEN